jgi:xylulokinase
MVDKAQQSPAGSRGLLFHSFLASQVTPYYDADSRGGLIGLGNYHTRVDLVRALLEGCAHEMKMVVDAFQSDIEGGVTTLRLTGGGTKSSGFSQIMTDIIGMETEVTREKECTVLGAAILGAYGCGHFASIDEAVETMVQIEGTFTPNKEHREMYEEQHGLYRGIYEAIANAGQYKGLANFSAKYF